MMGKNKVVTYIFQVTLITAVINSCVNCANNNASLSSASVGGFISSVQYVKNSTSTSPVSQSVSVKPNLNHSDKHRIIGGVETNRNEFPFIVSFGRNGKHFCGGAIIAPEWVLTAAHCASEPDFDVTAGEHNLEQLEGSEQKSRAVKVIRNLNYNPETYEDDICLVKVSPPFRYGDHVKPFAVPSTHYIASGSGTVAGWGTEDEAYQVVSPVLRKVTVPLVPSMECAKQYGSYFHPLKMMCAGLTEGGKDACQGDSGGPLMCDDQYKGATLCGVVSFGLGCARPELAGVYTKVAFYSDWIGYQITHNSQSGGDSGRKPQPQPPNKVTPSTPRPFNNSNYHNHHHHKPGNSYWDNIPPGHVVIIKPINSTRPHYFDRPNTTPVPRAGSSRVLSGTLWKSAPFLLLACTI